MTHITMQHIKNARALTASAMIEERFLTLPQMNDQHADKYVNILSYLLHHPWMVDDKDNEIRTLAQLIDQLIPNAEALSDDDLEDLLQNYLYYVNAIYKCLRYLPEKSTGYDTLVKSATYHIVNETSPQKFSHMEEQIRQFIELKHTDTACDLYVELVSESLFMLSITIAHAKISRGANTLPVNVREPIIKLFKPTLAFICGTSDIEIVLERDRIWNFEVRYVNKNVTQNPYMHTRKLHLAPNIAIRYPYVIENITD